MEQTFFIRRINVDLHQKIINKEMDMFRKAISQNSANTVSKSDIPYDFVYRGLI